MKKKLQILAIKLFTLFFFTKAAAVLDALNAIIQLDYHYSFTNREFARGFVKFNNGFDIPLGGTIILNVGQYINGRINFNNGTIILTGPLYLGPNVFLQGNGYIKTNNNQIIFADTLSVTTGRVSMKDNSRITSSNSGTLFVAPPGKLVINDNNAAIYLQRLNIFCIQPENCISMSVGNEFVMDDMSWEISPGSTLTISGRVPQIFRSCFFIGQNSTFSVNTNNNLWITGSANLTIKEKTTLMLPSILLQELDSHLTLNHQAKIYFTNTTNLTNYGYMKIDGKALLASNNKTITFGNSNDIQFLPGSKLTVSTTHLAIN